MNSDEWSFIAVVVATPGVWAFLEIRYPGLLERCWYAIRGVIVRVIRFRARPPAPRPAPIAPMRVLVAARQGDVQDGP